MINNEKINIIVTATNLLNEISKKRKKNFCISTNGVNVEDFLINKEENYKNAKLDELIKLKNNTDITLCYFGALAKWFDYKLIQNIVEANSNIGVVLIGVDYDMSFHKSGLEKYENVLFLGPIKYNELKYYASICDILTIPFIINEITESTSPVKLFEYMALRKPIITTNLRECRSYHCVKIINNYNEFIEAINLVRDDSWPYSKKMQLEEAYKNSWENKVKSIINLLEK